MVPYEIRDLIVKDLSVDQFDTSFGPPRRFSYFDLATYGYEDSISLPELVIALLIFPTAHDHVLQWIVQHILRIALWELEGV